MVHDAQCTPGSGSCGFIGWSVMCAAQILAICIHHGALPEAGYVGCWL